MSTENQNPQQRPRPDDVRPSASGIVDQIRENASSIRQAFALTGTAGIVLGGLLWIFIRDLAGPALIVVAIGLALIIVDIAFSWKSVRNAVLGKGGRFGLNSITILLTVITIAIVINSVLFWATNRPSPLGFLRVDTTATKQFILEEQAINTLQQMKEPVLMTAFFTVDTAHEAAAWRITEDLLSEFERRSAKYPVTYKRVDPELNPSAAARYGVTNYPAIVVEATESNRTEIIEGTDPMSGPNVISVGDIITGLLVVNQITQKHIMFISGHAERDITNPVEPDSYGIAARALTRENYLITNETLQELGGVIASLEKEQWPAAVVLAGPKQPLLPLEEEVLRLYANSGGSLLFLFEPNSIDETYLNFFARYGITVGQGEIVDTASFIATNPLFLQVKRSNGQFPPHEITGDFDVLYLPGATYIAASIDPETIPITDDGIPFILTRIIASSTLSSWAESETEGDIKYDQDLDLAGPLPLAISVEAIAELGQAPTKGQNGYLKTNMILIGETDFATNQFFGSARNGDLFVNSVNWLVEDFELITIRTKTVAFRELVLTQTERDFVRWSGWLLMPALIGLFGFWTWWRRR